MTTGSASSRRIRPAAKGAESWQAIPDIPPSDVVTFARRQLATVAVLGGTTFNLLLCFLNTRVMPISDTHVMLAELVLIGCAFLGAMSRGVSLYLVLTLFISYMLLLSVFRGMFDLKAIRDILIPVGFYFLGKSLKDIRLADRLVVISILIALLFALFEYLLLETYLDFFNVLGYFIARGTMTVEEAFGATRGLFASGLRPEPRTLLPFLGQHRVSGIFLEPVSAGNFGVIVYAWALFRPRMRWRYVAFAAALTTVVLADARFGFFTCIAITLLLPFYRLLPRIAWLILPFLFLAVIAVYGYATGVEGGANDLVGRFKVTAALITNLDIAVVLGIQTTDQFTADSGFAYTLTKFGIFGFIGLWAALVYTPLRDPRAWIFQSMVMIYLLLLMVISNSFFSIKTAALLWFLLGTSNAVDWRSVFSDREPDRSRLPEKNREEHVTAHAAEDDRQKRSAGYSALPPRATSRLQPSRPSRSTRPAPARPR